MNEESLFVAALEKPTASERQAFLEEACAGDVALRQRVERLLAAHLETLGILDQPARPPGWTEVAGGSAPGGVPRGRARRHRDRRPLQAARGDRRRRDGHGLEGRANAAGSANGGAEAHQGGDGLEDRPVAVRGGAAGPGPDGAPEHRQGARRRHDRERPAVLRHGVRQGRPLHPLLRRRPPDHRPAPRALRAGLPGRPARPHQGRDPPRPEAQQHPGLPVRRPAGAEGDRLRSGQGDPAAAHRAHAAHGPRRAAGHAAVHESGTGRVQQSRRGRADGRLRPRRDPLRAADRDDAAGATAFPGGGLA